MTYLYGMSQKSISDMRRRGRMSEDKKRMTPLELLRKMSEDIKHAQVKYQLCEDEDHAGALFWSGKILGLSSAKRNTIAMFRELRKEADKRKERDVVANLPAFPHTNKPERLKKMADHVTKHVGGFYDNALEDLPTEEQLKEFDNE